MRNVNNKKAIRRLADKSFRAARTRNIIAVTAIALTAMLFTALFTLGIGTVENFQQATMRQSGGDSHGVIKNLSPEQYEKLSRDPSIEETADCMLMAETVTNPEFLKRHAELWYIPEYHYPHCFIEIIEGKAPESADEILMDQVSMELLGLEAKAGQQVTLGLQIKPRDTETVERKFTVSGVIKADPALNVGFGIVSGGYREAHADELTYTYHEDFANTGSVRMDVNFSNSFSIQKKLEKVIANGGYSTDEIEANANWAYISDGADSDPITTGAVLGGLLLIMLTGYLIIYNIFQISVIRDIRYYGLLKTIGATSRQVKKILRRQALFLGLMGIPLGLVLGFLIGTGIMPKIVEISTYEYTEMEVSANPWIFLGAAVFTMLTLWISTGNPARIAAKVSPVEAVRYTDGGEPKQKRSRRTADRKGAAGGMAAAGREKKTTDGGKLWRMAFSNLGRNKKRTVLVLCSLSLAVVLLNSVFTVTHAFDMDRYLRKFVSSDFLIANAVYYQSLYTGSSEETVQEEKLTESFIKVCEGLDGFQKGGRLYFSVTAAALKGDRWTPPETVPKDDNGIVGRYVQGKFYPLNRRGNNYLASLCGMEDFFYDKLEIWKGESDLQVIREKLASGKYLLCSVFTDDNAAVEEDTVMHQPGDKIVLVCGDGQEREFEVLSLIKENYYGMTNRRKSEFLYYVPADVFQEMASDQYLMSYSFDVEDGRGDEIARRLESYTKTEEPMMHYESKGTWEDQFHQLSGLFTLVGGVMTLVVGLIGILNFSNSVLTGIVTRQQEFAMLEAIGMTKKQIRKMVVLEGLYYAGGTIVFSLVFGCAFSATILRMLTNGMWFMQYQFVIWPMLAVFPVLLLLGYAVPEMAIRLGKKESVVERLRRPE